MRHFARSIPILLLVSLVSSTTVARGFSLFPDGLGSDAAEKLSQASRWSAEYGLSDGIQVVVNSTFASSFSSDPAEQLLIEQAVRDAFAAWESPVLQFDVSFEPSCIAEMCLGATAAGPFVPYFGQTFPASAGPEMRSLTNGQTSMGFSITGASIVIYYDNVLNLSQGWTQAQKTAALQRLVMHEVGHALGLGHPNDNNPLVDTLWFFDSDDDPENLIPSYGFDPFSHFQEFLIGWPGTFTANEAIMSNRPCGTYTGPCSALLYTSLQNDDRGGRDVLYPIAGQIVANGSPVATGQLSLSIDVSLGFPAPYVGTITWDNASFEVLGLRNVNLGSSVGSMNLSGSIDGPEGSPPSGSFSSFQNSTTPGVLSISINSGDFICPDSSAAGCLGDFSASYVGLLDAVSGSAALGDDPGDLLPTSHGATYAEDGYLFCTTSGSLIDCSGSVALNAVAPAATPASLEPVTVSGTGTFVSPISQAESPYAVDITFDSVTTAGDTNIVPISDATGDLPTNFLVTSGDFNALYLELSSNAIYQSPITVCTSYPDVSPDDGIVDGSDIGGPGVSECAMRLLHEEGGTFQDRTIMRSDSRCPVDPSNRPCPVDPLLGGRPCIDRAHDRVCGTVTSLSPFVTAIEANYVFQVPALGVSGLATLTVLLAVSARLGLLRRRE